MPYYLFISTGLVSLINLKQRFLYLV